MTTLDAQTGRCRSGRCCLCQGGAYARGVLVGVKVRVARPRPGVLVIVAVPVTVGVPMSIVAVGVAVGVAVAAPTIVLVGVRDGPSIVGTGVDGGAVGRGVRVSVRVGVTVLNADGAR